MIYFVDTFNYLFGVIMDEKRKIINSKGIFSVQRLKFYLILIAVNLGVILLSFLLLKIIDTSDFWGAAYGLAILFAGVLIITIIISLILIIRYEIQNWNGNGSRKFMFLTYLLFWAIIILLVSIV